MKEHRNFTVRSKEVEEVSEKPVEKIEKKNRTGHISGCELLNVRKEPTLDAPVISVLKTSDSFEVQDEDDNSIFFKVKTSVSVSGYCMKKFVAFDD